MNWTVFWIILFFIQMVNSRKYRPSRNNRHKGYEILSQDEYFKTIADAVLQAESLIQVMCIQNNFKVKEVYEKYGYVIIYSTEGLIDKHVDIRISNYVLYTLLQQEDEDDFIDVRILPRILNLSQARWTLMYTELRVIIPYSVQFGDTVPSTCLHYDRSVFSVPNRPILIDIK